MLPRAFLLLLCCAFSNAQYLLTFANTGSTLYQQKYKFVLTIATEFGSNCQRFRIWNDGIPISYYISAVGATTCDIWLLIPELYDGKQFQVTSMNSNSAGDVSVGTNTPASNPTGVSTTFSQAVPCYEGLFLPTDSALQNGTGLIMHYTFDTSISSANAVKDATGKNTDLVLIDVLTSSNCIWIGSYCVQTTFTGYIRLPALNLKALQQVNGFTVCTWFKFLDLDNVYYLWEFYYSSSSFLRVQRGIGTTTNIDVFINNEIRNVYAFYVANTFTHICIQITGNTMNAYINGGEKTQFTFSNPFVDAVYIDNFIGQNNAGLDTSNVVVSDFRIYNYALSDAQVASVYGFRNYYCPSAWCQKGYYCPYGINKKNANMILYYPFSRTDPLADATRITGNLQPMGTFNMTSTTDCKWENGDCAVTSTTNYFKLPPINLGKLTRSTGFSLCLWWKERNSYTSIVRPFEFLGGAGNNYFMMNENTAQQYRVWIQASGTPDIVNYDFTDVTIQQWKHVCITNINYDWVIYMSGKELKRYTATNNLLADQTFSIVNIGYWNNHYSFNMFIDEFRLYNTILTKHDVQYVYSFRNFPCQSGSFQPRIDQTSCSWCLSVTDGTIQAGLANISASQVVPAGTYSPMIATANGETTVWNTNRYLIGYYTFTANTGNRLQDLSGSMGSLIPMETEAGITYPADGPWPGAESVSYTYAQNNHIVPPLSLMSLANANGFSCCFWVYLVQMQSYVWYIYYNTQNRLIIYKDSANLGTYVVANNVVYGPALETTNIYNNWKHVCVTYKTPILKFYVNGNLKATSPSLYFVNALYTAHAFGGGSWVSGSIQGSIDEVRYYKKELTQAEINDIYKYRLMQCPAGTYQDKPGQAACIPCAAGTYQPNPGKTTCITCPYAYNTYVGSTKCPGGVHCSINNVAVGSASTTPGTAQINSGANYVSFNCPSGTYSPTVNTITRLTDTCTYGWNTVSCTPGTCCIWGSSFLSSGGYYISYVFDGNLNTLSHTGTGNRQYYAIDMLVSTFVDSILVIDRTSNCDRCVNLEIYIGDSYATPTDGMKATSTVYSYPAATAQTNTLCYVATPETLGYRNPLAISCQMSGRYIYIVNNANDFLHHMEIIVLGTPACPRCAAGKYSVSTQPNTRCIDCPTGTYQSGVGMSYCNTCPPNTTQSLTGQTACVALSQWGVYHVTTPQNTVNSINEGLIAHYTFNPVNRLADYTGITGPLTVQVGTAAYQSNCQWNFSECASFNNNYFFKVPDMNFYPYVMTNGLSICFWLTIRGSYDRIFSFFISDTNQFLIYYDSVGMWFQDIVNPITLANYLQYPGLNIPFHICLTMKNQMHYIYVNSVTTTTQQGTLGVFPNVMISTINIGGYNNQISLGINALVDDFRIYNKALTQTEITALYNYRGQSCPMGTYKDQLGGSACTLCPPGYYQDTTGASSCKLCANSYNTWYGSIICPSSTLCAMTAAVMTYDNNIPGTAVLSSGSNKISFNCPSGTFSISASSMTRLTDSCQKLTLNGPACDVAQCCVYASSQYSSLIVNNLFDLSMSTTASTNGGDRSYFVIYFPQETYIDQVILVDYYGGGLCLRTQEVEIYVGNTQAVNDNMRITSTLYSYPLPQNQNNILCYKDSPATFGYRNPLTVNCNLYGRYVYIVANIYTSFLFPEIIVLGSPACPRCPVGTFSTNAIPSTTCISCTAGTYASTTGSSVCSRCPSGSYQEQAGASTCKQCPTGFYQPEEGRAFCVETPVAGTYSPGDRGTFMNNLLAYYSFYPFNRLVDASNKTGWLIDPNVKTLSYANDCQWNDAHCAIFDGTQYVQIPSINLARWSVGGTGFTICLWFVYDSVVSNARIFEFAVGAFDSAIYLARVGTTTTTEFVFMQGSSLSFVNLNNPIVLGQWTHLCIVNKERSWSLYENSVFTFTGMAHFDLIGSTILSSNFLGKSNFGSYAPFKGRIDEFRIYNLSLAADIIKNIYSWRPYYPCPWGSYQDEEGAFSCKLCGIGTHQDTTGQTACKFCTNPFNNYYGGVSCPSISDSYRCDVRNYTYKSDRKEEPGIIEIKYTSSSIYTFCPAGTYFPTNKTVTSITSGCTSAYLSGVFIEYCTTGTCCVWVSTQSPSYYTSYIIDGGLFWNYYVLSKNIEPNPYIAIDFGSIKTVGVVLIWDIAFLDICLANNNLRIYVGNTNHGNPSEFPLVNGGYPYPVDSQSNTLCYSGTSESARYRYPLFAECQATGRYLFIVSMDSSQTISALEVAVLEQHPCIKCPPGTYSNGAIPASKCTSCPAGTYQTGTGMTSLSTCQYCPLGQYSTGLGMTSSAACTACA
jgi:hypothetical protein